MTRKEWVNAPKNEKNWGRYNKARKHFPLCKLGKIVVLHHVNPFCTNYEEWDVDELVPMFTWCHSHLHTTRYQSEESLQKFLGNRRGKKHTPEARQKMSKSRQGKPWTEKRKATFLREGIFVSDETRKKISAKSSGHPGHIFTEEELKRMSEAHKGQVPPSRKGVPHTEETKAKMSVAQKGNKNAVKKQKIGGEVA